MKLIIGCDEAAYNLKILIIEHLKSQGHEVDDFGATAGETILYPDVAYKVADEIASGHYERGILLCGTGIGMSICANKVPGVRAAVCHDPFSAQRARKSNDAQIMCLGERIIGVELAKNLVDIWMESEFQGGGSAPKVDRISELEQAHLKASSATHPE
ncbi:ribose 5-phosphate isomerase B [Lachnospiraceae bacterium ZAX-1]